MLTFPFAEDQQWEMPTKKVTDKDRLMEIAKKNMEHFNNQQEMLEWVAELMAKVLDMEKDIEPENGDEDDGTQNNI